MCGRKTSICSGAFLSNSSSEKLIINAGIAYNQHQPLCAWGRRALLPLPPAALGSCQQGDLLLLLEWELEAGRADQAGSQAVQTLLGQQHLASPAWGWWLRYDRAASVLRAAQTPTRESQGAHLAGSRTIAWEMVACDQGPHPALWTAIPHGQHECVHTCTCGTLGRWMLQCLFDVGHTGASGTAELALACV